MCQRTATLRDEFHPDGLPDLTNSELTRVQLANSTYEATTELAIHAANLGASLSVENPLNSLFWLTTATTTMLSKLAGNDVVFDHCMMGGRRDKTTRLWTFVPQGQDASLFQSLNLRCSRDHEHASWKPRWVDNRWIFPTADEAAYPTVLCTRLASALQHRAVQLNFHFPTDLQQQADLEETPHSRPLHAGQPRGHKWLPLVSMYGCTQVWTVPANNADHAEAVLKQLPQGSAILSRHLCLGDIRGEFVRLFGAERWDFAKFSPDMEKIAGSGPAEFLEIGSPREPEDFVKEAIARGHPRAFCFRPNWELRSLAADSLGADTSEVEKVRTAFFKKWLTRALHLRKEEQAKWESLAPHLRPILKGKRLVLWKQILMEMGYADAGVLDEVADGFALSGWMTASKIFKPFVRPPKFSVNKLREVAKGLNNAVVAKVLTENELTLEHEIWKQTQEEVACGWLALDDDISIEDKILAYRFAVVQRNKVRMIDDFSLGGLNSTCGLPERLEVEPVDSVLAMAVQAMGEDPGSRSIVGRTYDLVSAYKQFGVCPSDVETLRIAVKVPGKREFRLYKVLALPFGAVASVAAFLRIARSIVHIAREGLRVPITSFFDDFTALAVESGAESTNFAVTGLFKLLGVQYAREGPKAPDFAAVFSCLGVVVDMNDFRGGSIAVMHTEQRVLELKETLGQILSSGTLSRKEAEKLRGRLIWFSSFVFGRRPNRAVATLSAIASSASHSSSLTEEHKLALGSLLEYVDVCRPVSISRRILECWYIFTDGAFEPHEAEPGAVGGVLVSPSGTACACFGSKVPRSIMDSLLAHRDHPIFELELLPVWISFDLWGNALRERQLVVYIDNSAAQGALVRGRTEGTIGNYLIERCLELEPGHQQSWYGRVPSHSNLSDGPSRLDFSHPLLASASKVEISWTKFQIRDHL